jgi:hypothetical protein
MLAVLSVYAGRCPDDNSNRRFFLKFILRRISNVFWGFYLSRDIEKHEYPAKSRNPSYKQFSVRGSRITNLSELDSTNELV